MVGSYVFGFKSFDFVMSKSFQGCSEGTKRRRIEALQNVVPEIEVDLFKSLQTVDKAFLAGIKKSSLSEDTANMESDRSQDTNVLPIPLTDD